MGNHKGRLTNPQNHMTVIVTNVRRIVIHHSTETHIGVSADIQVGQQCFKDVYMPVDEAFKFHKVSPNRNEEHEMVKALKFDGSKRITLVRKVRKALVPWYKRLWRLPAEVFGNEPIEKIDPELMKEILAGLGQFG